jgi:isopropylmalate/homocitrate/citramalate synthase
MKYKLRMTPDQVVDNAVTAVKHLRSLGCKDIEFSPEDAGARCCCRLRVLGGAGWALGVCGG